MNKNWILLLLAAIGLASCSIEKRVYQPGYHIEWNLNAEQDASRDAAQDALQDASRDAMQDASRDLSENLSENLETVVSQGKGQSIDSDLELVLYIALALFLPALVIFLMEGFSRNFWIALLLMVIAFSFGLPMFLQLMIEAIATVLAIGILLHYM